MRINYLAVLVAGVVLFAFGGLWYNLIFKSQYMAAVGVSTTMSTTGGATYYPYIIALVVGIVVAYAIARVLAGHANVTAGVGAWMGFMLGLLIFGALAYQEYTFEMRSPMLAAINIGFAAIGMAIQGAILGAWKPRAAR